MLVVNLIDKDRIKGEEGFGAGDSTAVWRARLFLFIGFALMAGGLAGSVVSELWYAHATLLTLSSPFPDDCDSQICIAELCRAVLILRLCERFAKRRPHGLCHCSVDSPKWT